MSKLQKGLTCLSIALSAIQANGVYCWPTYGPVVAKMLELNDAQSQTIVVGGILGVYLTAAPLGALTDRYGPRIGSLVSAILSASGYFSFATLLRYSTPETPGIAIWLTIAYFCIGAATVCAYFSCLTCASLSFPSHPTLSLSLPLSLVGMSSLCLSAFSTLRIFQSPITQGASQTDLDPQKFLIFLGTLCPAINLFGALFMRIIPPTVPATKEPKIHAPGQATPDENSDDDLDAEATMYLAMSQSLHLDERTPLLIGGIEAAWEEVEEMEQGKDVTWTVRRLLKDWEGFWAFGLILALCIGPSETIIASIGSIMTSLLPAPTYLTLLSTSSVPNEGSNALKLRNKHVMILSLSSTISRLCTGVIADYLCPPLVAVPAPREGYGAQAGGEDHRPEFIMIRKRPIRINRSMMSAICALALAGVYAWSAGYLEEERALWLLSGGVGLSYGALFTLTPAVVSAHFGPTNFGLAWGMVSYFAALGSVAFSFLYAMISVSAARDPNGSDLTDVPVVCYGPQCFRPSLWVAALCAAVSACGFFFIARRWKV